MAYHPPTASYYNWFGTDQVGQSVLAEFIWSSRISLLVGLLAAFMSTVLGAVIGMAYDEVLDPKLRKREDSVSENRFTARGGTPAVAMGGAGVGGGGHIK